MQPSLLNLSQPVTSQFHQFTNLHLFFLFSFLFFTCSWWNQFESKSAKGDVVRIITSTRTMWTTTKRRKRRMKLRLANRWAAPEDATQAEIPMGWCPEAMATTTTTIRPVNAAKRLKSQLAHCDSGQRWATFQRLVSSALTSALTACTPTWKRAARCGTSAKMGPTTPFSVPVELSSMRRMAFATGGTTPDVPSSKKRGH